MREVGVTEFESMASASRTQRSDLTELHPVEGDGPFPSPNFNDQQHVNELASYDAVGATGLKPAASWSQTKRSIN